MKKNKLCSECGKVLRIQNKSLLCSYHHRLKLKEKYKLRKVLNVKMSIK